MSDRPSIRDEGILDRLCERIIAGEGIKAICRDLDMPSDGAVYWAMAHDDEIQTRIARAREAQQDAMADENLMIADAATPEDVQVAKLRIWARQWNMARLAPKKYGDKVGLTGGDGVGPVQVEHATPQKLAQAMLGVLTRASEGSDD
jgi:hypothetical protein